MPGPTLEAQAVALFQAGRFEDAERAFRQVLAHDPRHRDALLAMGVIAGQSGRRDDAIAFLEQALAVDPRAYAAWFHLGSMLRQGARHDEAERAFRSAIALAPRSPEAHVGLANTLREKRDREGARASFAAALAVDPAFASAHYNLALLEIDAGRLEAAEACLARALEREPKNAGAWNNLGLVLRKRGAAPQRARECFERAVDADPRGPDALNNLALELGREGSGDAAIALLERALEARPAFAAALTNWGNVLKDRGDLDAALERYQRALAIDPHEPGALLNSGSIALERGRLAEARRFYERALEARPGFADARYSLGVVALFEHDFAAGWDGYERRFETDPPVAAVSAPRLARLASGEHLGDVRLAVRAEQGLGDQVLFSTLLPELHAAGAHAVVELDPRLLPAYRRSIPGFAYVALGDAAAIGTCERELPLGSLAALFRRDPESFDAQPAALLSADAGRTAATRAVVGDARTVGISWRSFQKAGRRHIGERKSIPLERFAAFERAGVRLLDVQYGDVDAERRAFDEDHPGLRVQLPGLDLREDIEGVLAAIAACDLVVTASNVTAHFAGALGKRTWLVYLGANPPFHYWAPRADGRALWYPSVEIVTDPAWKRWEEAFEALAPRLEALPGS